MTIRAIFKYVYYNLLLGTRMNWIDDRLAVGDLTDITRKEALQHEGIDLIIEVRNHFDNEMNPMKSIWKLANDLIYITEKSKVLIYCHGGIDRSPFVAMLYLKLKHGYSYEEAYKAIKEKRPQTIEHWDWVEEVKKW